MTLTYLIVALCLLVANGFFVGAEFGLMTARRSKIEELASEGSASGKRALASLRDLSFMLAAVQLGITMASLGLGFVAEPAIAHIIEEGLQSIVEIPESVLHTISFVLALSLVVFLHMVIGEMAPKNIAIAEPEKTALWVAIPLRMYSVVFRPFIWLLNAMANGLLRLVKVKPVDELVSSHSARELAVMISRSAQEGVLEKFKERLLSGAIELGERDAGSAMVSRTEVAAIPIAATPRDAEQLIEATGHSRFPIYRDDIDHVVGFIHAKDLLRVSGKDRVNPLPTKLIRPMVIVPESRKLRSLLLDMRRERKHFALVIDEHGGTAGIVTLEDLLEELVGEIRDEHDVAEIGVERLSKDSYLVPGTLRVDEAADWLGVELPPGEYETVSGFLMERLGRIPKRRDVVEHNGWSLRVRNMYRRRVVQVLIEPSSGARTKGS